MDMHGASLVEADFGAAVRLVGCRFWRNRMRNTLLGASDTSGQGTTVSIERCGSLSAPDRLLRCFFLRRLPCCCVCVQVGVVVTVGHPPDETHMFADDMLVHTRSRPEVVHRTPCDMHTASFAVDPASVLCLPTVISEVAAVSV